MNFDEDAKGSKIRESWGFSIHAPCGSNNKWCGRDKLDFSYSIAVLSLHCLLMSSWYSAGWNGVVAVACTCVWVKKKPRIKNEGEVFVCNSVQTLVTTPQQA